MVEADVHDGAGAKWWNSAASMMRVARRSAVLALSCFAVAALTWSIAWLVAVLGVVGGTTAVLVAAFAWFRLDDLRGRGVG